MNGFLIHSSEPSNKEEILEEARLGGCGAVPLTAKITPPNGKIFCHGKYFLPQQLFFAVAICRAFATSNRASIIASYELVRRIDVCLWFIAMFGISVLYF